MNPAITAGKSAIGGTPLPVESPLRKPGEGAAERNLLDACPRSTSEDLRATFAFAAATLGRESTIIPGSPTPAPKA
jgi:uncharacterized protein (DUF433 family)